MDAAYLCTQKLLICKNTPGLKKRDQSGRTNKLLFMLSTKKCNIWWRPRPKLFCKQQCKISFRRLSLSYINEQHSHSHMIPLISYTCIIYAWSWVKALGTCLLYKVSQTQENTQKMDALIKYMEEITSVFIPALRNITMSIIYYCWIRFIFIQS